MIVSILLSIPLALNVIFLIQLIFIRNSSYKKVLKFLIVSFFLLPFAALVFSYFNEAFNRAIDFPLFLWLSSGCLMMSSVCLKILIVLKIKKRYKDPVNYHYNIFGKKVIHTNVVAGKDLAMFFLAMPLFLFAGAYFVARIINLIMFGRL